jgi:hypothetical protein
MSEQNGWRVQWNSCEEKDKRNPHQFSCPFLDKQLTSDFSYNFVF